MSNGRARERASHRRRRFRSSLAARVPGVGALGRTLSRVADWRIGRIPAGLVALLPIAVFLDFFDAADEVFLGPVGMGVSFVLESAFLLAVTGRASWAFAGATFDVIPGLDVVPLATLTLLHRIVEEWRENASPDGGYRPNGPVIDV